MVKSMFAGVAGLKAHQQMMDVIGNNIANVNTPGYKAGSISFQDAIYQTLTAANGGNVNVGGYGGQNPSQVGYGVTVRGITYDMGQGGISVTGRGLDCMIDGTGFFIVGPMKTFEDGDIGEWTGGDDEDGTSVGGMDISNSGLQLSRVGQFFIDENGYLVDGNRNYIYGFEVTSGEGGGDKPELELEPSFSHDNLVPLRIPGYPDTDGADGADAEPEYTINSYTIKTDGTIVGQTDANQTVTIGKIALASVQNPDGLSKSSGYYYSVTDNSGIVKAVDGGGATGKLTMGGLEMAKVELANEFSQLILAQRGFQANSKIITVTDSMLEELVNMKR